MSSGYSASVLTGNGSGSATDCTSSASMTSSTSPVGRLGLIVSSLRFVTRPVIVTTLSRRKASACANSGDDTSMTHCVMP